jgi:predicted RNA binding protein YcfA (HicA-like mRNA interferase family)
MTGSRPVPAFPGPLANHFLWLVERTWDPRCQAAPSLPPPCRYSFAFASFHRTRGSHQQFRHPTKLGLVTIAGSLGDDLPPGTLNSILKQAGLK